MSSPRRAALVLASCVAIALMVLSVIDALTQERITKARNAWMLDNLSAVLPDGPFDQNPVESQRQHLAPELGSTELLQLYTAFQQGEPVAVVLEVVTNEGYSGPIRLLLGLHADGSIIAARVIEHRETPGLGDAIEHRKSNWINQFESRSIASAEPHHWQLKTNGGQYDGLTGATITSRAVLQAIHRAVNWYDAHRDQVFGTGVIYD
ncbi:MAG: RnfABCDGE type electron transport complex subunit G [Granulosicoccus sp.]